MDYGVTAALAGMAHVAKYGREWLYNFYRVHRDWVNYDKGPYAFVVPATQRVSTRPTRCSRSSIRGRRNRSRHRAFSANGTQYPAGSYVIKTAQPYGAFAKTMLEKQVYPDLRLFPGGPPEPPYDVTGHTLWMLMGVNVLRSGEAVRGVARAGEGRGARRFTPLPPRPKAAYLVGPESYGVFKLVAELQKASVPTFRAGTAFEGHPAGTFIIPSTPASQAIVEKAAPSLGLGRRGYGPHAGRGRLPPEAGHEGRAVEGRRQHAGRLADVAARAVRHHHEIVKAQDFTGDLNQKYDVILLPSGTSKARIVNGLDPKRNDAAEWSWAYGVGETGWEKLKAFVQNGGTLLAIGSAVRPRASCSICRSKRRCPRRHRGSARRPRARMTGWPRGRSSARCATRSAAPRG